MSDVIHLPWRQKPGLRTVYSLTLFSALLPVVGLSLVQVGNDITTKVCFILQWSQFQHQEARFLLPILPCVILMCAHKLRYVAKTVLLRYMGIPIHGLFEYHTFSSWIIAAFFMMHILEKH